MQMKRLILIVIVVCSCLGVWLSGGCEQPAADKTRAPTTAQPGNQLPSFVIGTWQQRAGVWRFVIEPNGVVSSAVIPLMDTTLRPHQTTLVKMKDENESTFTGGDMFAEYNPASRELFVFIELKKFQIRYYEIRTGGSQVDRFTGPVSENGKVWSPEWISIPDYGPELPLDANSIEPAPCIFDKVEEKQQPAKGQGGDKKPSGSSSRPT
jgi:hypothetical protein